MQERAHVRREALHLKRRDGSVAGAWSPGPLLAPLSELCALIHKALSNTRTWVHYEDGSASAKHPAHQPRRISNNFVFIRPSCSPEER